MVAPREIVSGRFEIERVAGVGGMGAVYRATDRTTGKPVALKVLHGHGVDHAERFAREARLLEELHHPAIVSYLSTGTTPQGEAYIALEWLEGETLAARVSRGPIPVAETLAFATTVAAAMKVAHDRGIVHRDLKPANLFLVDRDPSKVKVLDFGIARVLASSERLTATGAMLGTPGYMSPEQSRGERDVDARTDVFALGCVIYRMIAGAPVFQGADPMAVLVKVLMEPAPKLGAVAQGVPEALEELVDRMLAKQPADRPRDAGAVLEELQLVARGGAARAGYSRAGVSRIQMPSVTPRGCILLARYPRTEKQTIVGIPLTLQKEREARVRAAVASERGELQPLADGSFLVMFPTGAAPEVTIPSAARCALVIRPVVPEMQLALLAEPAGVGTRFGGGMIDQGVVLLERAGGGVALDRAAASALAGRFTIAESTGAPVLYPDPVAPSNPPPAVLPTTPGTTPPTLTPQPVVQAIAPAHYTPAPFTPPAFTPPAFTPPFPPAPRRGFSPLLAAGIGAVVALLAVATLLGLLVFRPTTIGPAPFSPLPAKTCYYLKCADLKLPSSLRIDPVELLPQVKAAIHSLDANARFSRLTVNFTGPDGTLNLNEPTDNALFHFASGDGKSTLVGQVNGKSLTVMSVPGAEMKPLPEPCALKRAWAVAASRGLTMPGSALIIEEGSTVVWLLNSREGGGPVFVNAQTCAQVKL